LDTANLPEIAGGELTLGQQLTAGTDAFKYTVQPLVALFYIRQIRTTIKTAAFRPCYSLHQVVIGTGFLPRFSIHPVTITVPHLRMLNHRHNALIRPTVYDPTRPLT